MAVQAGKRVLFKKDSLSITVSSSESVTIQDLINFKSQKYLVTIIDPDDSRTKYLELVVINDAGTVRDMVFGKFGSPLKIAVGAQDNSGELELLFTNNDSKDLDVCVTRINIS